MHPTRCNRLTKSGALVGAIARASAGAGASAGAVGVVLGAAGNLRAALDVRKGLGKGGCGGIGLQTEHQILVVDIKAGELDMERPWDPTRNIARFACIHQAQARPVIPGLDHRGHVVVASELRRG